MTFTVTLTRDELNTIADAIDALVEREAKTWENYVTDTDEENQERLALRTRIYNTPEDSR